MTQKKYDYAIKGSMKRPNDCPWGPQTEKALKHFPINNDQPPQTLIQFYILLKRSCALANQELGAISNKKASLIVQTCDRLLAQAKPEFFPLPIWISGSGTPSNMNINEVISSLATALGNEKNLFIHPNDDVNASQSTNDSYPTAIHITLAYLVVHRLMPELIKMRDQLAKLEEKYAHVIKIGRTHLQDAVPMTVGQLFGTYQDVISQSVQRIHQSLDGLFELSIGGTAIGTGLSAPKGFDQAVCESLSEELKLPFNAASNKFMGISMHSALNDLGFALSDFSASYNKIANDLKLLSSGPRCGLGEFTLPINEPGSSIMPGKINPTQCESASMVAFQVMSNQSLIQMCCTSGQLELNTYKPLIGSTLVKSVMLLSDSLEKFTEYCLNGLTVNEEHITEQLKRSLMLITGLKNVIGYDKCAEIAMQAYQSKKTIREIALELGYCDGETFDTHTNPANMIGEYHDEF